MKLSIEFESWPKYLCYLRLIHTATYLSCMIQHLMDYNRIGIHQYLMQTDFNNYIDIFLLSVVRSCH